MVGKRSGEVAYAIMSFGGFLGIGQKYHPLPWNALTYDAGKKGYVVEADKERLMGPELCPGEDPFSRPEYGQQVRDYWSSASPDPHPWNDREPAARESGRVSGAGGFRSTMVRLDQMSEPELIAELRRVADTLERLNQEVTRAIERQRFSRDAKRSLGLLRTSRPPWPG